MNLILVGFMGTGKSTVGKLLADCLGFEYLDTDQWIEERAECTVAEIFTVYGETDFRKREHEAAAALALTDRKVVATGGGFVLQAGNVRQLQPNGFFITLTATPEAIWERVKGDTGRPLLQAPNPLDRIRVMLEQRLPFYSQSDLMIDTTGKKPDDIVAEIISALQSRELVERYE